jgi:hypothetical protein
MILKFKWTTEEEYLKIKKELNSRFKFARVKRNNQNYAMGGFNVNPKDYDKGFTSEEIDKLCIFLGCLEYDDESLSLMSEEVYAEDKGEFAGTKIKYLILKNGFSFLMKLEDYDDIKKLKGDIL